MYKMNYYLKIILTFLILFSIVLTNNRIILWFFLLLLTTYVFYKENKLLIIPSLILVVFLAFSLKNDLALLLFKLGYIVEFLYLVYIKMIKKNTFKKSNKSLKEKFFEEIFDITKNNINTKKDNIYNEDISSDYEIERSLDRLYLQSRIRFNGFNKVVKNSEKWNKIDILILLFFIVLFTIIVLVR